MERRKFIAVECPVPVRRNGRLESWPVNHAHGIERQLDDSHRPLTSRRLLRTADSHSNRHSEGL